MNLILKRISKPEYKENQMSYGMKTYFTDKIVRDHSNIDELEENIRKR